MAQAVRAKPVRHSLRHAKKDGLRNKENNPLGAKAFGKENEKVFGEKEEKKLVGKSREKTFGDKGKEKEGRVALQDRTNGLKRKSENALSRSKVYAKAKKDTSRNPNKKIKTAEPTTTTTAPTTTTNTADTSSLMHDVSSLLEEEPKPANIVDIDHPSLCTELEVPEYSASIMKYLFAMEKSSRPSPGYLLVHKEVNEDMRNILVNWLFEVHLEFRTLSETLFLAVSLLDRYLERNIHLSRRRLQLVGLAAIFIACKYEQTYLPSIAELVDICAEAYTGDEILEAESEILRVIEWDLSAVTSKHFLKRFSKASGLNNKQFCLASYFTELTLPEYQMLTFPPSMIAASAIFVTRKTCDLEPFWTPTIEHYTTYTEEQIRPCAKMIITILKREASRFQKSELHENGPVTVKYSSHKLYGVAPEALARVTRNVAFWREGKGKMAK
eukprot:CAMPEP_0201517484 /NCGR_PEP_ID=MMETSP0161_2-20130828/8579_1 /ASSEMBLY_ACC=CAM_ASM_000251 /TAXON_ID=180227 /ORGANISM="Neoparamoeba aestuarina, Strain SoJaBio B1-5/56/2" /LENGTH=441 /DNA_ID=CAMNT_0047914997 /DNA_START=60 /DNA_END=1385 /DNA_ORIENTATION=+